MLDLLACSPHPRVTSCADDLTGVWVAPGSQRWMFLDHGSSIEAFPIFADNAGSGDVVGAPRVIDLHRAPAGLEGQIKRRFGRRGDFCDAHAAMQVTACGDELDVTVSDPPTPLALAPCQWPAPAASRTERWHRE